MCRIIIHQVLRMHHVAGASPCLPFMITVWCCNSYMEISCSIVPLTYWRSDGSSRTTLRTHVYFMWSLNWLFVLWTMVTLLDFNLTNMLVIGAVQQQDGRWCTLCDGVIIIKCPVRPPAVDVFKSVNDLSVGICAQQFQLIGVMGTTLDAHLSI